MGALKRAFPVVRRHGSPERRSNLALRTQSDLMVTVTAQTPVPAGVGQYAPAPVP